MESGGFLLHQELCRISDSTWSVGWEEAVCQGEKDRYFGADGRFSVVIPCSQITQRRSWRFVLENKQPSSLVHEGRLANTSPLRLVPRVAPGLSSFVS